jgi:hypothetical protein
MNKALTAYSHGPSWEKYVVEDYDKLKHSIINPKHWMYGSKLVKMKRIKIGIELKCRLLWKASSWRWKPSLDWRYNRSFHWLFFMCWCSFEFADVPDKVIKDHLAEVVQPQFVNRGNVNQRV